MIAAVRSVTRSSIGAGIDVECPLVDVAEHRHGTVMGDRGRPLRCTCTPGRSPVPGGDPQARDRGVQRRGAGVGGYAVGDAEVLRPFVLEADDRRRVHAAQHAPVKDREHLGTILVSDSGHGA